jgi:hypothetical protein
MIGKLESRKPLNHRVSQATHRLSQATHRLSKATHRVSEDD